MTNLNYATPSFNAPVTPLDRAVRKAYWRLLPLLFLCYVIAYVDRVNVSIAKLTMQKDLPSFNNAVIGFGAGIFFIGYFLLEIPGTLLVEKWSARKWISRIMISWGIVAAVTACVHYHVPYVTFLAEKMVYGLFWVFSVLLMPLAALPFGGLSNWASLTIKSLHEPVDFAVAQFYSIRFLLGLAEAGFFPGVIVYMTHWFPARSRSRALSVFLIATPFAQILSPKISNMLLRIGTDEVVTEANLHYPILLGLTDWPWVFFIIYWVPTVILAVVIIKAYLSQWVPNFSRFRATLTFSILCPLVLFLSNKIWAPFITMGTHPVGLGGTLHHPELFGLEGWQWIYISWGIPAVLLGIIVLFFLTDHPHQAKWLTQEECSALENTLAEERSRTKGKHRMTFGQALRHPKVLLLSLAYFCIVTGNYGTDFFLPSILKDWYKLTNDRVTTLVLLPPIASFLGTIIFGWNSDRTGERRMHAVIPGLMGAIALGLAPSTKGNLPLTLMCFMVAAAGLKAYLPAFWTLPSIFLTSTAAAGSIGLINSIGNLGGQLGPAVVGKVQDATGSFSGGIYTLSIGLFIYSVIIFLLGLGHKERVPKAGFEPVIKEPAKAT